MTEHEKLLWTLTGAYFNVTSEMRPGERSLLTVNYNTGQTEIKIFDQQKIVRSEVILKGRRFFGRRRARKVEAAASQLHKQLDKFKPKNA